MKKFILLLTALTAATALSAHAQITVDTYTSTADWNALESNPLTAVFTANASLTSQGTVTSDSSLIQTFTLTNQISVASFQIRFREGGDLGLAVYQVANANQANPLTLGNQTWSGNVTLPDVGTTNTFANMTLATPVNLAAGAYAFVIDTSSATNFGWRRTTSGNAVGGVFPGNVYADGRAYATGTVTGGGTNFDDGSSEFFLAVVAVPEPSTLAFLAAGALALVALRRRRN
jgi:hypothetical protein